MPATQVPGPAKQEVGGVVHAASALQPVTTASQVPLSPQRSLGAQSVWWAHNAAQLLRTQIEPIRQSLLLLQASRLATLLAAVLSALPSPHANEVLMPRHDANTRIRWLLIGPPRKGL